MSLLSHSQAESMGLCSFSIAPDKGVFTCAKPNFDYFRFINNSDHVPGKKIVSSHQ